LGGGRWPKQFGARAIKPGGLDGAGEGGLTQLPLAKNTQANRGETEGRRAWWKGLFVVLGGGAGRNMFFGEKHSGPDGFQGVSFGADGGDLGGKLGIGGLEVPTKYRPRGAWLMRILHPLGARGGRQKEQVSRPLRSGPTIPKVPKIKKRPSHSIKTPANRAAQGKKREGGSGRKSQLRVRFGAWGENGDYGRKNKGVSKEFFHCGLISRPPLPRQFPRGGGPKSLFERNLTGPEMALGGTKRPGSSDR